MCDLSARSKHGAEPQILWKIGHEHLVRCSPLDDSCDLVSGAMSAWDDEGSKMTVAVQVKDPVGYAGWTC